MEGGKPISSYRDLDVWQEVMTMAEACYMLTKPFPREEAFGMTSQIRRSAASVAANIAEGHGRESTTSFINFLRIGQGSLKELETHLILASRVGLAAQETVAPILARCEAVGRQLRGLIRSLQRRAAYEKDAR
ncbi:four helix bundle protein [Methylobacterium sp. J-048]|uniref:four helix bundle protein n=1 Tax=Methylobacterium sp. J-048 TaxID=2836635 RepID=UPI001FBBADB0|nr:four helix bundle protein [Methylobacterium sp. J-048]MCJ2056274.1 four helix bundle protein [Methylobacterium sp. J-048]